MKRSFLLVAAVAATLAVGHAALAGLPAPSVPAAIAVPDGHRPFLTPRRSASRSTRAARRRAAISGASSRRAQTCSTSTASV
jgi:hypothetical protein